MLESRSVAADVVLRISAYRTEHGAEVDLIAEIGAQLFAIEVKASTAIASADVRGLQSFGDYYGKIHRSWIVYQGIVRKRLGDVEVLPWQEGIREMCRGVR